MAESLRIAGIGKRTKGIALPLSPGESLVIGRHADCSIVCRASDEDSGVSQISRHHAVVEQDESGQWVVYDTGSRNGTIILRRGLPPSIVLDAGMKWPLEVEDVIELAASNQYQFEVQAAASPVVEATPLESRTLRILDGGTPSLQVVRNGLVIDSVEIDERELSISGDVEAPGRVLRIDGLEARSYATVRLTSGHIVLRSQQHGLHRNLDPISPGSDVTLRDKDLVTLGGVPELMLLALDSRQLRDRNLSDLLANNDRVVIGTDEGCTCRILDPTLSREHAEVCRDKDGIVIADLNSRNGTRVDGRRIVEPVRLVQGSRIMLGRLPFVADGACWKAESTPRPSIDVRFLDVNVEIAGKLRLRSVSLGIGQGQMVGLLGPSASGKSTMLRVLSGDLRTVSGEIYVNGRPMKGQQGRWDWLSSLMGYRGEVYEIGFVHQIDLVQADLTVREVLEYAGRHMGMTAAEAARRASEASDVCNLGSLMDGVARLASGELRLSGGQLKRVCVAIEILRSPRILLLDEPTTGQDPKNTDELMKLFRSLAQSGVTLLMSTHDLRNLAIFDKVAVLCLGRLVYFGSPAALPEYFSVRTAEEVYASLPDSEKRDREAVLLESRFRQSELYREHCAGSV